MTLGRPPRVLTTAAAVSAAVVAVPLVYLLVRAFEAGWGDVISAVGRARTAELALNSLLLALSVGLGSLVIGVPTAWLLTRTQLPWMPLWRVLAALPLAVPSYVAAYGWKAMFPQLGGFFGAFLVITLVSTPYVTLPVAAALRRADTSLEDVARTLGMGRLRASASALIPQVLPAAMAGALLASLYALADFGAVAILRYEAFTYAIQQAYKVGFDRTLAAVLALLLVLLAGTLVIGERAFRGQAARREPSLGVGRSPALRLGWRAVPAMVGLAVIAVASVGVPLLTLMTRVSNNRTLESDSSDLFSATVNTVLVSVGGALITVALALPIGVLAARYRGRLVSGIESASYLGNALPGIVVGLAMIFVTLRLAPSLYQTAGALALAYAVMFLPKAVGAVRTSFQQVPTAIEDVGRTLGLSVASVWWSLTGRIALPSVAAGWLLVMLTAMKELPATLMLRPIGMETLATELWARTAVNAYGAAAPYAAALMIVAALPAYALSREERVR